MMLVSPLADTNVAMPLQFKLLQVVELEPLMAGAEGSPRPAEGDILL